MKQQKTMHTMIEEQYIHTTRHKVLSY